MESIRAIKANHSENIIQMASLMKNFIRGSMIGTESALFKVTSTQNLSLENLKLDVTKGTILMLSIQYLNICYKSLILKDDQYVVAKFKEMTDCKKHSEICLLNIFANIMKMIIEMSDRSNLDVNSYDKYMDSVKFNLDRILDSMPFGKNLSHECNGIDISTCDPNDPMFKLT